VCDYNVTKAHEAYELGAANNDPHAMMRSAWLSLAADWDPDSEGHTDSRTEEQRFQAARDVLIRCEEYGYPLGVPCLLFRVVCIYMPSFAFSLAHFFIL
jgi:hypothetical protein